VFEAPSVEERAAWRARIAEGPGAHADIASSVTCLTEVDEWHDREGGVAGASPAWLRIAAWNIERGRDAAAAGSLLASVDADVVLLSEVDRGMARSANVDVFASLASSAGAGVAAFGVEFVELGLGDAREWEALAASGPGPFENQLGLHGNAVLSRIGLDDACVLRLDAGGDWFTEERGQPRVGGRCAVAGRAGALVVVSVHLESGSTARARAVQLGTLLAMVDERFGAGSAAVVGGDLNTFGAPIGDILDRTSARSMRAEEPTRFSWPVPHEPLFEDVAAAHGYGWVDANVAGPTTHHGPDSLPDHVPMHLDWLLVRGVEARRPAIVTAGGLSDHELVAVSVRLSGDGR
jgi:endonuclease/exonuclease/phosphatase family metal-dependent hydrolase